MKWLWHPFLSYIQNTTATLQFIDSLNEYLHGELTYAEVIVITRK